LEAFLTGCIDFDCFIAVSNNASFDPYFGACLIFKGDNVAEKKVTDDAKDAFYHWKTPHLGIFSRLCVV
tara:strand:- start:835 stop:1041 length:207 start_codon:yes stop_codon:yes gene_type:complete